MALLALALFALMRLNSLKNSITLNNQKIAELDDRIRVIENDAKMLRCQMEMDFCIYSLESLKKGMMAERRE